MVSFSAVFWQDILHPQSESESHVRCLFHLDTTLIFITEACAFFHHKWELFFFNTWIFFEILIRYEKFCYKWWDVDLHCRTSQPAEIRFRWSYHKKFINRLISLWWILAHKNEKTPSVKTSSRPVGFFDSWEQWVRKCFPRNLYCFERFVYIFQIYTCISLSMEGWCTQNERLISTHFDDVESLGIIGQDLWLIYIFDHF